MINKNPIALCFHDSLFISDSLIINYEDDYDEVAAIKAAERVRIKYY